MTEAQPRRPIVFFDLETTGVNTETDRIVEIGAIKHNPDGTRLEHRKLVNPGIPIPAEASAVHGITDEMVANERTFPEIAAKLHSFLDGCDLGGYNIRGYDLPLLQAEFARAGIAFNPEGVFIYDPMIVFHQLVGRTLQTAYRFYCGKTLENAHSALADITATEEVFFAQLKEHGEVADLRAFHDFCDRFVDKAGKFVWNEEGEALLDFGKNRGTLLRDVAVKDRGFLEWMLRSDFPEDTKKICRDALAGRFPRKGAKNS